MLGASGITFEQCVEERRGSVDSVGDLIGSLAGDPYVSNLDDSLCYVAERSIRHRWEEVFPEDVPGVVAVNGVLGRGTFAHVHSCDMVDVNGDIGTYAVKIPWDSTDVVAEAQHHMILSHPNLVEFLQAFDEPAVLVLELCVGGTLLHALQSNTMNAIGFKARVTAAIGIADAVAYIHEQGFSHLDIKSGNVFLSTALSGTTMPQLKLGDFGSCTPIGSTMTRCGGTLRYMAPEVMTSKSYCTHADIYSLGMFVWELLTGRLPFLEFPAPSDRRLIPHVVGGGRPDLSMFANDPRFAPVANVVATAWSGVQEERPPAAVLMRDLQVSIRSVPEHIGVHATGQ